MQTVDFKQVEIKSGFFRDLQTLNAEVSVYNIYKRFQETGRFHAMKCIRDDAHKPHVFWDSDIAKWLESVANILAKKQDAQLKQWADEAIADICSSQLPCGYFNSYFQVYEPENIFQKRPEHELYCAGHLIEAAVALHEAGVDDKLYAAMIKYADYIYERFYVKKDAGFFTCGHPEIELALVKLYNSTGAQKYLDLADYFIEERGRHNEETYAFTYPIYHQDHAPVREQKTAEGHAVRALYLYIAMADVARLKGDKQLAETCETLFEDIVSKKMYITGGTGSSYHGETFTFPYDLPNIFAYSETCSAIALAFFCDRLAKIKNRAVYHEIFERVLYNNILAGESKDGKGFFYVNPLEFHEGIYDYNEGLKTKLFCPIPERVEVFDCSCCPPNLTRFIESVGGYIYGTEGDFVYINQYISSSVQVGGAKIEIDSEMPYGGRASFRVSGDCRLKLRVPAWNGGVSMKVNGKVVSPAAEEGYISLDCRGETKIALDFHIKPKFVYANENVWYDNGRKAVEYGAMILCAESADNGKNLRSVRLKSLAGAKKSVGEYFTLEVPAERLRTGEALYSYQPPVPEKFTLKFIPYFSWANRGKGDMQIWFL